MSTMSTMTTMTSMSGNAIYGLLSQGMIVAMIIRFAREKFGRKSLAPFGLELWIPLLLVVAIPIGNVSIAAHLRGLWGDPSIVTFALLVLYTVHPAWLPNRPSTSTSLLITSLVMLPLYGPLIVPIPMMQTDLYSLGWQPRPLLIAIAVILAAYAMLRAIDHRWVNIISIALMAYTMQMMESSNIMDYLVDPGLLIVIAFLANAGLLKRLRGDRLEATSPLQQGAST